ncbi:DMT family transporter [Neisseria montereyensis]|uniref:DMT family transporter n=1 Tax=Neisseria montereyensis TaxID=2973938 RepID=A0ABT2FDY0_9NEIS|nr:DMT family transporter [Neisseria montereyensis]MCS4534155.1 DMT family transporter [Neisseria montereyensis]
MTAQTSIFKNLPLLVIPPLLWAGNVIAARSLRGDFPPLTLSFGRWLISLMILLPFVWKIIRHDKALYRKNVVRVVGTALTGIAAFNTLVYIGAQTTSGTNLLLLNSCSPILIMLIGSLFYGQKLNRFQIVGLLLSLVGVVTIIVQGHWGNILALHPNDGDLWMFLAVVCWAFYTLWMRDMPLEINRFGLMAVQMMLALPILLGFSLWELSGGGTIVWNSHTVIGLAYVGIFPSLVAYCCYTALIVRVGALSAGLTIYLIPVFGVLAAVTLLNEKFYFYHLIGIATIFGGIILSNKRSRKIPSAG